jgi:UDP-N-acetylglucosamine 2-epimerase (non-hydrolysing)
MLPLRICAILGTRPEAVKLAPVVKALGLDRRFEPVVVATGQHRDLVTPALGAFGLCADVDLSIGRAGQSLNEITCRVLAAVDPVLRRLEPTAVVVQSDTTTAVAAALAAAQLGISIVHVEAGLRSGNRHRPFPEEGNRRLLSALADLHLAPTPSAVANLLAEGVDRRSVVCTGNTVVDSLCLVTDGALTDGAVTGGAAVGGALPGRGDRLAAPVVTEVGSWPGRTVLVTVHRRESWGEPITRVAAAVRRLAAAHRSLLFVVPMHPNPVVRASFATLRAVPNIRLIEPLEYPDLVAVLLASSLVLTDSGGLQEEAPTLGVPTLVMRDVTERTEALGPGVELVGTDEERIVASAERYLDGSGPPPLARFAYGDGHAARRCTDAIAHLLGCGPAAAEWKPDIPMPDTPMPDTHGPDTHGPDTHGPDHAGPTTEAVPAVPPDPTLLEVR